MGLPTILGRCRARCPHPMTTPLVVPPCHALARDVMLASRLHRGRGKHEAARDAAGGIVADYAPLPPVVSIADAIAHVAGGCGTSRSGSTVAKSAR